jgi:hypothetical protein
MKIVMPIYGSLLYSPFHTYLLHPYWPTYLSLGKFYNRLFPYPSLCFLVWIKYTNSNNTLLYGTLFGNLWKCFWMVQQGAHDHLCWEPLLIGNILCIRVEEVWR